MVSSIIIDPSNLVPAIQVNLQHKIAAANSFCRDLTNLPTTIAFIQEPRVVGRRVSCIPSSHKAFVGSSKVPPRATLVVPKALSQDCFLLREWSCRDLVAVRVINLVPGKSVILTSHYMDGTLANPVSEGLRALVAHCSAERLPLILGCDSNSHSTAWGSKDCNSRGNELEAFCATSGLGWANTGNKPTFVTSVSSSLIDLSLFNSAAANLITGWRHSSTPSLADHVRLEFNLDFQRPIQRCFRNTNKCNWELFRDGLTQKLAAAPVRYVPRPSPDQLDSVTGHLTRCLINSFEEACPVVFRSSRKAISWWSPEVAKVRTKVRALRRKASRSGSASIWDQYKAGLKEFKKLVRKAKHSSWKEYTSKVESMQAVSRLSKVLQRVESGELGALKRDDGTYTSMPESTLDLLADTFIPSHRPGRMLMFHLLIRFLV